MRRRDPLQDPQLLAGLGRAAGRSRAAARWPTSSAGAAGSGGPRWPLIAATSSTSKMSAACSLKIPLHAGVRGDGVDARRHRLEQRAGGLGPHVAGATARTRRSSTGSQTRDLGARVLQDVAGGLVEELPRQRHVALVDVVDLAEGGQVGDAVPRTGGDRRPGRCPRSSGRCWTGGSSLPHRCAGRLMGGLAAAIRRPLPAAVRRLPPASARTDRARPSGRPGWATRPAAPPSTAASRPASAPGAAVPCIAPGTPDRPRWPGPSASRRPLQLDRSVVEHVGQGHGHLAVVRQVGRTPAPAHPPPGPRTPSPAAGRPPAAPRRSRWSASDRPSAWPGT